MGRHLPSLAVAQRLLSYTLRAGGWRPSLPVAHSALSLSPYSLLMSPAVVPGWDTIRFSIESKGPRFNSAQGSENHRLPSQPDTAPSQCTRTIWEEEAPPQYAACILPSTLFHVSGHSHLLHNHQHNTTKQRNIKNVTRRHHNSPGGTGLMIQSQPQCHNSLYRWPWRE